MDLPDGFIDLGETAENCLKREVKEKWNLIVTDLCFFGTFPNEYPFGGLTYFTIDIAFECRVESFMPLLSGDDAADVHFIHPQKINSEPIGLKSVKKIITEYRKLFSAVRTCSSYSGNRSSEL